MPDPNFIQFSSVFTKKLIKLGFFLKGTFNNDKTEIYIFIFGLSLIFSTFPI